MIGRFDRFDHVSKVRRHFAVLCEHVVPTQLIKHDAPTVRIACLFDDGHRAVILPLVPDG
jgi:hypothetical protein